MSDDESIDVAPEGGEGKEIYPYGEYEGGRDDHLNRHGFGSALLPNSDIYEGSYIHGKRHGLGLYCFKNGARYYGEWKKGLKHGHGVLYYPDGSKYVGLWRKDLKHGHGFYYYANGDIYEGNYYKNQRCGLGSYKYTENNVIAYGVWKDGQMNGSGVIRYLPYRFHGYFEKNLPKGPGCFTFDGKYILHGFYVNLRDPAFDYVSNDVLDLEGGDTEENKISTEQPKGIVPIWRSRNITEYKEELLPSEPLDFPRPESLDSVMDIIEYLQKQYGREQAMPMEEEMDEHRQTTTPVPTDLMLDDETAAVQPGNIDV
ncbi:radial spoke head 1 homolog [Harmonia axyridis]|uniref:radial spoke head 1 homolog n=1 Tax=Harmonia axyridis TaxID=115357 RepID=UPI001E275837|nr:radial spoke head 1 homolog [Harmonia axyridis]